MLRLSVSVLYFAITLVHTWSGLKTVLRPTIWRRTVPLGASGQEGHTISRTFLRFLVRLSGLASKHVRCRIYVVVVNLTESSLGQQR